MSHNIENIKIVKGSLRIKSKDLYELKEDEDSFGPYPESCFIDTHQPNLTKTGEGIMYGDDVTLEDLQWAGTVSGCYFDSFKRIIIPLLAGDAIIQVAWEDGEVEYSQISNGKITKHELSF